MLLTRKLNISTSSLVETFSGTLQNRITGSSVGCSSTIDQFGLSVSLSQDGNTLAVTSQAYGGSGTQGKIWIYTRSGSTWSLQTTLSNPNIGVYTYNFAKGGVDLSYDGNTIITGVGIDYNGYLATKPACLIYTRSNGIWSYNTIIEPGNSVYNNMGSGQYKISGNGNTILMSWGDWSDQSGAGGGLGKVFIYGKSGNSWSLEYSVAGTLSIENLGIDASIDYNGVKAIVSSAYNNYIYTKSNNSWSLEQTISKLGSSYNNIVSISGLGNTVVIFNKQAESANIYTLNSGIWEFVQSITPLNSSGTISRKVQLSYAGDVGVVGNSSLSFNIFDLGRVFPFIKNTTWTRNDTEYGIYGLMAPENYWESNLRFGNNLALSADGKTLAVSAQSNSTYGAVYIYGT